MSTLQSGLGDSWGDDGYQWPEWLEGFSDPVVRSSTNSQKKMHAPDLTAEEAKPACITGARQVDMLFVVTERENLEGFYSQCGCDECQQWFDDEVDR